MTATRRRFSCALHPLALAAAVTANLTGAARAQQQSVDATGQQVSQAKPHQTVEPKMLTSVIICGARESASTRLPLTASETPQSVSNVSR